MPEVIVLDTHIWIWFITQEFERFPSAWRNVIDTAEDVAVASISCYEVALAHRKGRLRLPCPVDEWLEAALTPTGITQLPLTPEVACQGVTLSPIHKDPFDRLIIATALVYQAQLASVDGLFRRYPELHGVLME
jgi:PIN domain nuclease of toxin-antitoxin system